MNVKSSSQWKIHMDTFSVDDSYSTHIDIIWQLKG